MLKANAWPYPVFEPVDFEMLGASFDGNELQHRQTSKGFVVDGHRLRALGVGTLTIKTRITTSAKEVARHVFGRDEPTRVSAGFRIFCETSKYRCIVPVQPGEEHEMSIPLQMVRGGVQISPLFTANEACTASNRVALEIGSLVGYAKNPITLAIDEDWTGEHITIRWVNFETEDPPLPRDALFHVELSGAGEVLPQLWLNERFKNDLGSVMNHVGLASSQAIAGHVLRQFLWFNFWERAVPWAIKFESEEHEEWPASRIGAMWRAAFRRNGWEWPTPGETNLEMLGDLSTKIQHHLKQGEALAQVRRVWRI